MTPPHSSCSSACDAIDSPRMVPSHRTTATPVSSHEVSIPSTVNEAGSCGGAASTEWLRID